MFLDWKTNDVDYFVIDIESDGLHPSVIWCMCWLNIRTGEKGACLSHQEIEKFFEENSEAYFIGHNILKYDAPHLVRLCNARLSVRNCIDTLVLGTLYSPNIDGGHSLEEWGRRLGYPKTDFHDWSKLTPEMVSYCHQDVLITGKLYVRLVQTLLGISFSELSCRTQHWFTVILERQRKNGFQFDGPRAISLYTELRAKEESLEEEIRKVFPPERRLVAQRPMFRKDGSPTTIYLRDQDRYFLEPDTGEGRYSAYEDVPFSIGSPLQRTRKLLDLGWEPEEFTPKTEKGGGGNPKPFDKGVMAPSLVRFLEDNPVPEVNLIGRWMTINGRANMINTWLENWNEDDRRIHGRLFVADTLRLRHQAPNTANIPAVRVKEHKDSSGKVVRKEILFREDGDFTYEARDLWTARSGRVLVGTDAAGLELRMLAHYLGRASFTEQVVNGDPHQYNADQVGITRPQAKTLIYAILYGAGDVKIAKTLKLPIVWRKDKFGVPFETSPEGKKIKELFLERLGLKELIDECKREHKHGRVSLVDGSQVICPSPHAALNYKLQGGGARVMALGCVILEDEIRRRRLDSLKVGDIHDEWQYDCHPRSADDHATASVEAIREAGRQLGMAVPLNGEAKKGLTWAETH